MSDDVQTVEVELAERSYPVHIGDGLIGRAGALLASRLPLPRAIVVTNPVVASHWLAPLRSSFASAGIDSSVIIVADGEQQKTLATVEDLLTRLLEARAERRTTLIALGGGVVGDIAGFTAAIYQRGMPFIQVPTTLLAQVDSSVGGKTGVNHPLGKNMIGAFHQPRAVISDTATLSTLPDREYIAGIAEVIKCGAIRDLALFEWLEANMDRLLAREPEAVVHAVLQSCRIKAEIVAADERETGERALLNFGHTFGHAIEAATGYGSWLHGEAVAAGMVLAATLSERIAGLPAAHAERLRALIGRAGGLPTRPPSLAIDRWLDLMAHDKKTQHRTARFVLLTALGAAVVQSDVAARNLRAVLQER